MDKDTLRRLELLNQLSLTEAQKSNITFQFFYFYFIKAVPRLTFGTSAEPFDITETAFAAYKGQFWSFHRLSNMKTATDSL